MIRDGVGLGIGTVGMRMGQGFEGSGQEVQLVAVSLCTSGSINFVAPLV